MNLNSSEEDRNKLFKAVTYHHKQLDPVRKLRREAIQQCAGDRYVTGKEVRNTIVGMMRQALEAHVLGLAANLPRVLVTAKQPDNAGFAKFYTQILNMHLAEIRLENTLMQVAYDSFFGSAFVKCYLAESLMEIQEDLDVWVDPGKGFAERKSIDDLVYDTTQTDFRKCTFVADRYMLPLEALLEDKQRFSKKAREALMETIRHDDRTESRYATSVPTGEQPNAHFMEMIDLVDVYIPRERRIYTFAANDKFDLRQTPPLQVIDWDGDDEGPYKHLNLGPVPDNLSSSSPANYLYHLDMGVNQTWRKLMNQMQRQKVIGVAQTDAGNDEKDIQKFNNAQDGEVISGDPTAVSEVRFGGPDNQMLGTVAILQQLFDRVGGNLPLRAGLGAATDTASQDQMLSQQITRIEAGQQYAFKKFTESIVRELARMLFDDPASEYTTRVPVANSTISPKVTWQSAEVEGSRQGNWDSYEYCIEPNSMAYRSQQQRAQELRSLTNELIQTLPMAMQMGVDIPKYVEMLSELYDLPRLKEIFAQLLQPPPEQQQQPHQQGASAMGKPNGQYTRRNVSGGDVNGSQIQQMLSMGSGQESAA